jgi:formylmethanofuran dehydrogenase subunit C
MNGVELILRNALRGYLDASGILPEHLLKRSEIDIAKLKVSLSGLPIELGDLFTIKPLQHEMLSVQGEMLSSRGWGEAMTSGAMRIEGNLGDEVAADMRGGELTIYGRVGDLCGAGMRRGVVKIHGDAGDFTASCRVAQRRGMRGGLLWITGNVGSRAGDRMRRGTLLIGGDVGNYCGSRMIAGTIAIWGRTGSHIGAMMRRGTLWCPYLRQEDIQGTFSCAQTVSLPHLPIWYRWLRSLDPQFKSLVDSPPIVHRWVGDRANQGLGELLQPISVSQR